MLTPVDTVIYGLFCAVMGAVVWHETLALIRSVNEATEEQRAWRWTNRESGIYFQQAIDMESDD